MQKGLAQAASEIHESFEAKAEVSCNGPKLPEANVQID